MRENIIEFYNKQKQMFILILFPPNHSSFWIISP